MNYYIDEIVRSFKQKIVTYLSDNNLSMVHFYDVKERLILEIVNATPDTKEQILSLYTLWDKIDSEIFYSNLQDYMESKVFNRDVGLLIISHILLQLNEASLSYFDQKIDNIADMNDKIHHLGVKYSQKILLS